MHYIRTLVNTTLPYLAALALAVGIVGVTTAVVQAGTDTSCPQGQQYVSIAVNGQHCIAVGGGTDVNNNIIFVVLKTVLRFLAAGVGLAVAGGIIWGGYLYITARANASQVEKAKVVIINSIIGLLLFVFMYAILQFLIPGGIFT